MTRFRPRLTYSGVASTLALVLALTTGAAYAANEWTGANIQNGSLTGADIKNGSVTGMDLKNGNVASIDIKDASLTGGDILNGSLTTEDILDGSLSGFDVADNTLTGADVADASLNGADVADGSISSADIANGTLSDIDILDNSITTFDLAADSVDSDEVLDFGLSNQDIGVLYAQVNSNGTLAASSGSVISSRLLVGEYEVDFGRNIAACAFVATQGEAGRGGAPGAILGVTDREGNVEAVFVMVRNAAGDLVDRAFQLIVVC